MAQNVAQKLIESHLVSGRMEPGEEIGLRIDQTLTQDATGTLVMLELEAMGLDRVKTELSAQYVDHNLLQADERNADDHLFLYSSCRRFGIWFSKPGNGVSHPVHMSRFGIPGKTMAGSDSHTCAAGAIGMLAFGTGGLEVALAMVGEPLYIRMPEIWGVRLTGELQAWVSAKDVILELLRRHDVKGGRNRIVEYYGPGLSKLTAWDRHVIANMGADRGAKYDIDEEIVMSTVEPLIAKPSSPGNVVPVREVAGAEIYQVVIGSSANPGFRDFAVASKMVEGKQTHPRVSFDVNPTSRQILEELAQKRLLINLVHAGARLHQAGCLGCIGMGQAPATGQISLRTMLRNFPGRSGVKEDLVYLCSPETAAASALTGRITDPRDLDGMEYPKVSAPTKRAVNTDMLVSPLPPEEARNVVLIKGPNIVSLPELDPLPDALEIPVLLKVGDNVSTDEIMPAGQRVLPFRSNVPAIAEFVYTQIDETYPARAKEAAAGHCVFGGGKKRQGAGREGAASRPRGLGVRVVVAKDYARIHWQNLPNFGVLPLSFDDVADYDKVEQGDVLAFDDLRKAVSDGDRIVARNTTKGAEVVLRHDLSPRQVEMVLAGGLINVYREH